MNRLLGINDKKNYKNDAPMVKRLSVRGIIIEDDKIYLSHSRINNTYKLPGGGVDDKEDILYALKREIKEEVGFDIDLKKIKYYGYYKEIWKSIKEAENGSTFFNVSHYYLCKRVGDLMPIIPTESELKEECERVFVEIDIAIKANEVIIKQNIDKFNYLVRENEIFQLIKKELLTKQNG